MFFFKRRGAILAASTLLSAVSPLRMMWAQMSPGALSRPHQDLDSPLQCSRCHAFGTGRAEFKCLDCHEEIRRKLAARRGLHSAVVKPEAGSNDCARCHAEHNGRAYQLVRWKTPVSKFDHREAGWQLEGKHARLQCAQCHQPKNIPADERTTLKRANLAKSWLGLRTQCLACHADEHRGQLEGDCGRCHSQETWKNPPGFHHESSRYPLAGKHLAVACEKCHTRSAAIDGKVQYRNFGFYESCKSCHKDVHGGAFRTDCAQCHATSGWLPPVGRGAFDHSRTKFPLEGKHAAISCRKCHKTENFSTPIPHERCLDCHPDEHQGQFSTRPGGAECAPCHTAASWKPSRFGVDQHRSTRYPLTGMHATVECAACHKGEKALREYHPAFASCRDCHRDRHAGQFAGAPHENRCEQCHTTAAWKPGHFSVADHRRARFALSGAHMAVACSECHKGEGSPEAVAFHLERFDCAACHGNPHRAPSAPETALLKKPCEGCHTLRAWKDTGPFDHSETGFPLLGRHRTTPCTGCHKPAGEGPLRRVSFTGTARECGACHVDAHAGQFHMGALQPDCARCHTSTNWQPTEFDHSRHSRFSLAGAHERVPCRLCHTTRRQLDARSVVIYKGTPTRCEACH